MRFSTRLSSSTHVLLILLATSTTSAQFVVDSLSFGHSDPISPNGRTIPSWTILPSIDGHDPSILSDRVILTPPAPGNRRGGLVTQHTLTYPEWNLDVEFRASGPERGSGNMQIWVTKEPPPAASVYTAEAFDGLLVEIDQYGGGGGAVRGFLNDGSVSYKGHHAVDLLAFGYCNYPYRNLGRMSRLRVRIDGGGLEVLVDDRSCFKSGSIQIPQNYYLGVSAASAENPDSFEINKFVVSTTNSITRDEPRRNQPPPQQEQQQQQQQQQAQQQPAQPQSPPPGVQHPQSPANPPQTQPPQSDAALREISSRLDSLTAALQALQPILSNVQAVDNKIDTSNTALRTSIDQLSEKMQQLNTFISPSGALLARLSNMEANIAHLKGDLASRDYGEHLTGLQTALRDTQDKISSGFADSVGQITGSAPRLGMFVGAVVSVQGALVVAYIVYKRRRGRSSKKFL